MGIVWFCLLLRYHAAALMGFFLTVVYIWLHMIFFNGAARLPQLLAACGMSPLPPRPCSTWAEKAALLAPLQPCTAASSARRPASLLRPPPPPQRAPTRFPTPQSWRLCSTLAWARMPTSSRLSAFGKVRQGRGGLSIGTVSARRPECKANFCIVFLFPRFFSSHASTHSAALQLSLLRPPPPLCRHVHAAPRRAA